jgi:hypothetical protein
MNEGHVEFPFSAKGEKSVSCAFGCRILQSVNAD